MLLIPKTRLHLLPLRKQATSFYHLPKGTTTSYATKAIVSSLPSDSHSSLPCDEPLSGKPTGSSAHSVLIMATGDEALAGQDETIRIFGFPPDDTNERTIQFKGYYLSIYNEETEDYKTHIMNKPPTTTFESYTVPAGYSVHVRAATVKFEV